MKVIDSPVFLILKYNYRNSIISLRDSINIYYLTE